jgi:hypothetical protein
VREDGRVVVVAGDGRKRYRGDGGAATEASLREPRLVAVLADGSALIGSPFRVRRVTPDGLITTVAGIGRYGFMGDGGPATLARITGPQALAPMPGGGFLMIDGNRIRKVSADGTITTVAGGSSPGFTRDGRPAVGAKLSLSRGLVALADGSFVFAEIFNGRVRRVTPGGTLTTVPGGRAVSMPSELALAPDGSLFVVGGSGGPAIIRRIAPDGAVEAVAGRFDRWPQLQAMTGRGTAFFNGDGRPAVGALVGNALMSLDATAEGGLLIAEGWLGRVSHLAPPNTTRPAAAIVATRVARHRLAVDVRATIAGLLRVRVLRGTRVVARSSAKVGPDVRRVTVHSPRVSGLLAVQTLVEFAGHAPAHDEVGVLAGDLTERVVRIGLRRYMNATPIFHRSIGRCHRWSDRRIDCAQTSSVDPRSCLNIAAVVARPSGIPGALTYRCRSGRPAFTRRPRYDRPNKRHPLVLLDPRTPLPRASTARDAAVEGARRRRLSGTRSSRQHGNAPAAREAAG